MARKVVPFGCVIGTFVASAPAPVPLPPLPSCLSLAGCIRGCPLDLEMNQKCVETCNVECAHADLPRFPTPKGQCPVSKWDVGANISTEECIHQYCSGEFGASWLDAKTFRACEQACTERCQPATSPRCPSDWHTCLHHECSRMEFDDVAFETCAKACQVDCAPTDPVCPGNSLGNCVLQCPTFENVTYRTCHKACQAACPSSLAAPNTLSFSNDGTLSVPSQGSACPGGRVAACVQSCGTFDGLVFDTCVKACQAHCPEPEKLACGDPDGDYADPTLDTCISLCPNFDPATFQLCSQRCVDACEDASACEDHFHIDYLNKCGSHKCEATCHMSDGCAWTELFSQNTWQCRPNSPCRDQYKNKEDCSVSIDCAWTHGVYFIGCTEVEDSCDGYTVHPELCNRTARCKWAGNACVAEEHREFKCIENQCVPAIGGGSKTDCEEFCGTSLI